MKMKWIYRLCLVVFLGYLWANLEIERDDRGEIRSIWIRLLETSSID